MKEGYLPVARQAGRHQEGVSFVIQPRLDGRAFGSSLSIVAMAISARFVSGEILSRLRATEWAALLVGERAMSGSSAMRSARWSAVSPARFGARRRASRRPTIGVGFAGVEAAGSGCQKVTAPL